MAAPTKPRILCVDDEPIVLEGLRDSLRRSFDVRVEPTAAPTALALLRREPTRLRRRALRHADAEMPGSVFLREAAPLRAADRADAADRLRRHRRRRRGRQRRPDLPLPDQAVRAATELHAGLRRRAGSTALIVAERDLLEQTLHGSVKALTDVLSLASPAAFGRGARLKEPSANSARATGSGDALGDRGRGDARPPRRRHAAAEPTAEKLYAGAALTTPRRRWPRASPQSPAASSANIPRLEGVRRSSPPITRRFDSCKADGDAADRRAHAARSPSTTDALESEGVPTEARARHDARPRRRL